MNRRFLSITAEKTTFSVTEAHIHSHVLDIVASTDISFPPISENIYASLESAVSDIISKSPHFRFSKPFVYLTIDNSFALQRNFSLPRASDREIHKMLLHQMDEHAAVDSHYFSSVRQSEKNGLIEFSVAALPRLMCSNYYRAISRSKSKPIAMEIKMNVLSKLFSAPVNINGLNINNDKKTIIIEADKSATIVYMLEHGQIVFCHSSWVNISRLSSEIDLDQNSLVWANSILQILRYVEEIELNNTLDRVLVYGECADNENALRVLSSIIGLPVKRITEIEGVRMINGNQIHRLFIAVAALLGNNPL